MNWIVFDYGDVLSKPSAALPDLAAAMGAPLPDFLEAYWEYRIPYDAGSTPRASAVDTSKSGMMAMKRSSGASSKRS